MKECQVFFLEITTRRLSNGWMPGPRGMNIDGHAVASTAASVLWVVLLILLLLRLMIIILRLLLVIDILEVGIRGLGMVE